MFTPLKKPGFLLQTLFETPPALFKCGKLVAGALFL